LKNRGTDINPRAAATIMRQMTDRNPGLITIQAPLFGISSNMRRESAARNIPVTLHSNRFTGFRGAVVR
jgi:hypothetical protein